MKELINKVINKDCLEVMKKIPDNSIDLVLTDPPYPDYYEEEYKYNEEPIKYLDKFKCKQLIFWTAKEDFILDYTAIHIWDKKIDCGSYYERIFERNGQKNWKIFRQHPPFYTFSKTSDLNMGHKSQKPLKLMEKLVLENSKEGDIILDPFLGSGTTAVACQNLKRNFIGIEIDKKYCEIAKQRLRQQTLI